MHCKYPIWKTTELRTSCSPSKPTKEFLIYAWGAFHCHRWFGGEEVNATVCFPPVDSCLSYLLLKPRLTLGRCVLSLKAQFYSSVCMCPYVLSSLSLLCTLHKGAYLLTLGSQADQAGFSELKPTSLSWAMFWDIVHRWEVLASGLLYPAAAAARCCRLQSQSAATYARC